MPHKIEITDKTYERLKEFCSLNGLKIGQYADKLIFDGLMIEMYGDVPFTDYRKPKKEMKEIPYLQTMVKEFPPEKFEELYQANPGPPTKEEAEELKQIEAPPIPEETIARKRALDEEFMRNLEVPTKVLNKINKRRLK